MALALALVFWLVSRVSLSLCLCMEIELDASLHENPAYEAVLLLPRYCCALTWKIRQNVSGRQPEQARITERNESE